MQINMRKILAVLSCVAMLCTLLPLAAFSVFAADVNIAIPNGDFESSDLSAWKIGGGRLSTATAHGGAQSLYSADNLTAYAYSGYVPNIEVAPNSDYTVEFWFCYEVTAAKTMRLYVADGGGSAGSDCHPAARTRMRPADRAGMSEFSSESTPCRAWC